MSRLPWRKASRELGASKGICRGPGIHHNRSTWRSFVSIDTVSRHHKETEPMVHYVMISMTGTGPNVDRFAQWCTGKAVAFTVAPGRRIQSIAEARPYLTPYAYHKLAGIVRPLRSDRTRRLFPGTSRRLADLRGPPRTHLGL